MSARKRLAALLSATAVASGLALLPASPAFAASCQARANFSVSGGGQGSLVIFNGTSAATQCAQIQAQIRVYFGGTHYYSDVYGPVSTASSAVTASPGSHEWYGHAKPSITWSYQRWYNDQNNTWKTFVG